MRDPEVEAENHMLLHNVCVTLAMSPCLEPHHPVHPSFKVNFEFTEALKLHANWTAVHQLLHMKNKILVQLENKLFLSIATKLAKTNKKEAKKEKLKEEAKKTKDIPDNIQVVRDRNQNNNVA